MILADENTSIVLPDGMSWTDELSWSAVVQSAEYSVAGALIVQTGTRQSGRPITLQATETEGWRGVTRAIAEQIAGWASIPGKQLTLTRYGSAYAVMFRHQEDDAFSARPLGDAVTSNANHPQIMTIKLMVI